MSSSPPAYRLLLRLVRASALDISSTAKKDLRQAMETFPLFPTVQDNRLTVAFVTSDVIVTFNVDPTYPTPFPRFHVNIQESEHPCLDDGKFFCFETPPSSVEDALGVIVEALKKRPPCYIAAKREFESIVRESVKEKGKMKAFQEARDKAIPKYPKLCGRDIFTTNQIDKMLNDARKDWNENKFSKITATLKKMLEDNEVSEEVYHELLSLIENA